MNALAPINGEELDVIKRTSTMLALSNYFEGKGNNPQAIAMIATKILAGRELGFGPFAAVNGIHIISGKPAIGANLMAAAVKSSGRYDYKVREINNERCRIEFFERQGDKWESCGISEFTKEDAVNAGTQNTKKFARNMFFARAMSNGVRWYAPDVFSGNSVYVPEELGADVDDNGDVVEATYRNVDTSTGEVVDTPTPPYTHTGMDGDELFEQAKPRMSDATRQRLDAIGKSFYGEKEWPEKQGDAADWISTGAAKTLDELTENEALRLIRAIESKAAKAKTAAAPKLGDKVAA